MSDRFTWEADQLVFSDLPKELAENGPGYNPNRDAESGRFTWGSGGKSASKRKGTWTDEGLKKEASQYDTPEAFLAAQGKPVYHGTNAEFDKFDSRYIGSTTDDGLYGRGFYFADSEAYAKQAPFGGGAKNVMEVYLDLKNPLVLRDLKSPYEAGEYLDMVEEVFIQGSDGLVRPIYSQVGQFTSHVQEVGHDGVIADRETVVFEADKIRTKQNLLDIYNQAHKNSIDGIVDNARGYNPNRDEKTGEFTFGPKKQKATIAAREKDIRHNDYETFVAVDGSGKILLDKKGEKSQVLITREESKMMKEAKDVVFTHNHPSSAAFSKNDLITGSNIDAKEIRITSEKYEYSFKPSGPDNKFLSLLPSENGWADAGQISQMYDYFNAMAYNKYMPVFKSGKISEKELWLIHTDEVMENLASELKSTYTRKELK